MIAITGAAGFIGSNLAEQLSRRRRTHLLLVDHPLTPAKAANLVGLKRLTFLEHDEFLDDLTSGRCEPEVIFHLGACSSTTETNWEYLRSNNLEYTRRLWQWCAARGRPFLYASSAATYGDGSRGFDDETPPEHLTPLNLYAKSKNDFDVWAVAEARAGRPMPPRWAGFKFFNVYGPREAHKGPMASVVYQAWRQIRATGQAFLFRSTDPRYPDGGQLRDFVFVGDCVEHLIWFWQNDAPNGLYNSGTGTARTFRDLVTAVFAALKRQPDIRFVDMPSELVGRYQNYTRAEVRKLRQAGYTRPATGLEDGVRLTIGWLETHAADPT